MTGSFIFCGTPKKWVGLGVFGLGHFSPFPLLVEGYASEKYVQLAYTIGKLSWVVLPICHKPKPNRHQPAPRKAGSSISVTDFIFFFSLPISSRCDVLFFCKQVTCPLGAEGYH